MFPNFIKLKIIKNNPVIARAKPAEIQKNSFFKRGFSLIELLVVMSIMVIVTTVSFSNYPRMNSKLSLDLTAQDIALTVRQAQVYGTTVFGSDSGVGASSPGALFKAYGVNFPKIGFADFGENGTYAIFADSHITLSDPTDPASDEQPIFDGCGWESGVPRKDNCVQNFILNDKQKIVGYCRDYSDFLLTTALSDCFDVNNSQNVDGLTILFRRPNLEAIFDGRSKDFKPSNEFKNVAIIVEDPTTAEKRAIVIWKSGQISIQR